MKQMALAELALLPDIEKGNLNAVMQSETEGAGIDDSHDLELHCFNVH